jgi:hypothetical protein
MSTTDFFREPVRFLKESNTQESMMEKPYLVDEYPKMHLSLPDFKFKPKEIPSIFGPIADGDQFPGLATINFGDAKCGWGIANIGNCISGPVIITIYAHYFWRSEFDFVAGIAYDSIGVSVTKLSETKAFMGDKQDYMVTFPNDAKGVVVICGSASTYTLISQTFETVVAGMPVGLNIVGGALVPLEKGQGKSATLLRSVYGSKGDSCGCITLESDCEQSDPSYGCGDILYTSLQMDTEESQELEVDNPFGDVTYDWEIIDGDGNLTLLSGPTTQYTAPSDNVNCANNPTITLSINGYVCSVLKLAINSPSQTGWAYMDYSEDVSCTGYCQKYVTIYRCNGAAGSRTFQSCVYNDWIPCSDTEDCGGCNTGNHDIRTALQKEEGCCPAGLL